MSKLSKVHPELVNRILWVQKVAQQYYGVKSSITSGYRTYKQQLQLYRHPEGYPVSPPGCTSHELGVAVDLVANRKSDQAILMSLGRQAGLYTFKEDPIHFVLFSPADLAQIRQQVCGIPIGH